MISNLKLFSLCTVAEDKPLDEYVINVFPNEHLSHMDGGLSDVVEVKTEVTDEAGNVKNASVNKKMSFKAMWLALGCSNRGTPPDVRKGETVVVWRYANADLYYWETFGNAIDLRRREIVTYRYGNTEEFGEELGPDNTYWFTFDTINKIVKLHTSDNDEELTTYDIEINTKDGTLTIADGKKNSIVLDSGNDTLTIDVNEDLVINNSNTNITSATSINIATKDMDAVIDDTLSISLTSLVINSGSEELVTILTELIQANIDEQHKGNMGAPTVLMPNSMATYEDLLSRLETFKK